MSLINDMLRDIEAKRPNDPVRQNLQREIRSLPAASGGSGKRLKLWLALAVSMLAGAVLLLLNRQWSPAAGSEPAAPLAATAPVPAPAAAPLAPPLLESRPVAVAAAETAPEKVPEKDIPGAVQPLLLKAAPVLTVPDPVMPAPPTPPVAATPAPAGPAATVRNEAPVPAQTLPTGPAKIEKIQVLATARDRADAEYRKAENAQASGRGAEAIDGFRAALKLDPTYVLARQMLLHQLLDTRKTDEAIRVLQEGIELQPAQTGWAMSLARLQLEKNDVAAADRTLAASQSYAEGSADYAGFQGHLKTRLGAQRAAVTYYQRATRLAPQEGRWWLGLGLALEAEGRGTDATEAFRRSLASNTLTTELAAVAEQHLH